MSLINLSHFEKKANQSRSTTSKYLFSQQVTNRSTKGVWSFKKNITTDATFNRMLKKKSQSPLPPAWVYMAEVLVIRPELPFNIFSLLSFSWGYKTSAATSIYHTSFFMCFLFTDNQGCVELFETPRSLYSFWFVRNGKSSWLYCAKVLVVV